MKKSNLKQNIMIVFLALVIGAFATAGFANTDNEAPVTPATTFHGLPGNNPGHGGSSANPQGVGVNGGNGIHDIADVQANGAADTGKPPACTAHGGLGAANNNCN